MIHGGEIYGETVVELDFSVSLNPFGPPPALRSMLSSHPELLTRYPDQECRILREKLSEAEKLPAESYLFGAGASELINLCVRTLDPGSVLLPIPAFVSYERILRQLHTKITYYPLQERNDFALTEDFLTAFRRFCAHSGPSEALTRPRMLILCNPNNPTGRLADPGLLREIAGLCLQNEIYLLLDECFLSLCSGRNVESLKALTASNPFLLILDSFTKKFAMPGLRLGYLIGSDLSLLRQLREPQTEWSVSSLAQQAGILALSENPYPENMTELIRKEVRNLTIELSSMGFQVYRSDTLFFLFRSFLRLNLGERLLSSGILIRNCANFTGLGEDCYRIAVKEPEANRRLLREIEEITLSASSRRS